MFLLIHWLRRSSLSIIRPLHSTMFLLIPNVPTPYPISFAFFTFHYVSINTMIEAIHKIQDNFFTFHYVSINTVCFVLLVSPVPSLHSTMFLLILSCALIGFFLYRPLHSTMFLLIHSEGYQDPTAGIATLHSTMFLLIRLNASLGDYMYKTLHSTMFLLIQERL